MRQHAILVCSAAFAGLGCGGSDLVLPSGRAPAVLAIESGNFQSGTPGAMLPDPLVVRVTDAAAQGLAGTTVTFSPADGGAVLPASVTTGADGLATVRWTLDEAPGTQQVSAQVVGGSGPDLAVTFTAIASNRPRPSTVRLTEHAPDPSSVGQPVSIRVLVEPASGGGTPTGSFTVSASTGEDCVGDVESGACEISFDSPGPRTLVARYQGNDEFESSESAAVSHTVQAVASPTVTTIGTSPNPSEEDEDVEVSVTVRGPGSERPGGAVRIYDQGSGCGQGALLEEVQLDKKGQAKFITDKLEVGVHVIRACYEGTPQFAPSEATATQLVLPD